MKFVITQEWLTKTLERCGDDCIAVGGTPINAFKKEMELRTVTPTVFRNVPTQLGKVVRYVREQKGWSITEMAELADIDESDLASIETMSSYDPSPRTVIRLADVCHFKRDEFVRFANHRIGAAANDSSVRFAANSREINSISEDEYDVVRALVEVLTQHT